jgi:hypothetical protein
MMNARMIDSPQKQKLYQREGQIMQVASSHIKDSPLKGDWG